MDRRDFLKNGVAALAAGCVTEATIAHRSRQRLPFSEHPGDETFSIQYDRADAVGQALNTHFIWTSQLPQQSPDNLFAAFRRILRLSVAPKQALLHIFAYTRYRLYINGNYVLRGPARYQNNGPQYDTIDVTPFFKPRNNLIAIMVYRDLPAGRIMFHQPGLTALLDMTDASGTETRIVTDSRWRAVKEAAYLNRRACWGSITENIDARKMDGQWTQPVFNDLHWPAAIAVPTQPYDISAPAEISFAPLRARSIPLQREKPVAEQRLRFSVKQSDGKVTAFSHRHLPITLHAPATLTVTIGAVQQAYTVLDFEAQEGSTLRAHYFAPASGYDENTYIARAGRQTWMSGDTFGMNRVEFHLVSGVMTIRSFRAIAVNYPFERIGRFVCSDPLLNRIWNLSVRSVEVLSEDAYVDCADRERVEWMDCSPPAYQLTRLTMSGPGLNGAKLYSDPRLHRDMLRREALTQRASGVIKAHTCSERWDIHAIMLDRACEWVQGLRLYYDNTGDKAFVAALYPFVLRLMNWFLRHRTRRGLVQGSPYYEWVVWGNPMGYQQCEGTCLNAFIYRALADAAYMGQQIGERQQAEKMGHASLSLFQAVNSHLWDNRAGSYYSGIFANGVKPIPHTMDGRFHLPVNATGQAAADLWAAIFTLYQGIVPPQRRERVLRYMTDNMAQSHGNNVMIRYFLAKLLFSQRTTESDLQALDIIRQGWNAMANSPSHTTWESLSGGGSHIHIYGASGAIPLITNVLGVQMEKPVWEKQISVAPRTGNLSFARGVVCTELGPVRISWRKHGRTLVFTCTVPAGATATLCLPCGNIGGQFTLNGKMVYGMFNNKHVHYLLDSGQHNGSIVL